GSAKARDSERRRISKRSTEVGGRGPVPRRSCERIDNRGRVVAEEALGKRHVIRPSADIVAHCEQVRQLPTSLLAKSDQVDGVARSGLLASGSRSRRGVAPSQSAATRRAP